MIYPYKYGSASIAVFSIYFALDENNVKHVEIWHDTFGIDAFTEEEFEKGLVRMKRLINASKNGNVRCHDNALTGIRVSFDIKYPQYWTPEAQ